MLLCTDVNSACFMFFAVNGILHTAAYLCHHIHVARRSVIWRHALHRLLRYDPFHNSTEVMLNNLHFANGVQLSRYDDFVLVAECSRARIIKSVYQCTYLLIFQNVLKREFSLMSSVYFGLKTWIGLFGHFTWIGDDAHAKNMLTDYHLAVERNC